IAHLRKQLQQQAINAEAAYPTIEPLKRSLLAFQSDPEYRLQCYERLAVKSPATVVDGLDLLAAQFNLPVYDRLGGLLNGREMASENAKSLQQKQADRKALIERINNRFSGKSDTAMSAIQSNKTRVSIAAELNRRPELAAMNQALRRTKLVEQFQLEGMAATVFVPRTELLESANAVHSDSQALEDLLKYHIVYGELTDDWFEKGESVVTQRKLANRFSEVSLSFDETGIRQVNGKQILSTIEATNGRICFVDGILDPASAPSGEAANFSQLLRSQARYQMMAEVMESPTVIEALSKSEAVTVLAAPDKTLSKIEGGLEGRAAYALEQLIIPEVNNSHRLKKASTGWLLPLTDGGPTRGWAVRSTPPDSGFKLFQIGPEGLPSREVAVVEKDIEATGGLIHLIEEIPSTPSMTRGGLLEQNVCREILKSALERCEIRKSRGEVDSAITILKSVHEGQAAATYDTAAICKSYLEANLDNGELPDIVPAHIFTILNAGFIRGLSTDAKAPDAILHSYQTAIELAKAMLEPTTLAGASKNSAVKGLSDRLDSYRTAVDLERLTLRLQGLPDKAWLGDRDLFLRKVKAF
ncbi:MAG: fasciclin domain-containing protein, partial [Planctomycetota bacterium]